MPERTCYNCVYAADYEWLTQWQWYRFNGYAVRRENHKVIFMHRQIMQPPDGKVVDHADCNRDNKCRSNLRTCTHRENSRNQAKHSSTLSRFKGVMHGQKGNKWYPRCQYRGKIRPSPGFETDVEAARAYDRQAFECFGEFARPNFPREWPPERRAEVHAAFLDSEAARKPPPRRKRKSSKPTEATTKSPLKRSEGAPCDTPRKARKAKAHPETAKGTRKSSEHGKETRKPTSKGMTARATKSQPKTKAAEQARHVTGDASRTTKRAHLP